MRKTWLLAVVLLVSSSAALLAQAPPAAQPQGAAPAVAPVTLADIFAPAPTLDAKVAPQGRAPIVIHNPKSNGIKGTQHSFSRSLSAVQSDICAEGSCDCNICSCYGTEDCCAAGCAACFAVACGFIT
ncbi:MAG TPA: hypothetical protein VGE98_07640 [Thermoanaerobaculia bacterium]